MTDTTDWTEAGNGGESWKPENIGDFIVGTYKQKKENVGVNKSNVYVLQEEGKEGTTTVWGSTVLDGRFEEIPLGSLVKIEFTGREKGKAPQPYKTFKVLYKPNPVADVIPGSEVVA